LHDREALPNIGGAGNALFGAGVYQSGDDRLDSEKKKAGFRIA